MADSTSNNEARVEYMLTTVDNPFDPFTQFDSWLSYDTALGYDTPGYLDRIAISSDDLSELDEFVAIQDAIEEIVRENVMGVHRKVKRGQLSSLNS